MAAKNTYFLHLHTRTSYSLPISIFQLFYYCFLSPLSIWPHGSPIGKNYLSEVSCQLRKFSFAKFSAKQSKDLLRWWIVVEGFICNIAIATIQNITTREFRSVFLLGHFLSPIGNENQENNLQKCFIRENHPYQYFSKVEKPGLCRGHRCP